MSPAWEQRDEGYVITPAYLLFNSGRMLGVRISCFPSPHVQTILHPWINVFLSCELEKMDVLTSPLFPGNSIFLPHTVSLSLPPTDNTSLPFSSSLHTAALSSESKQSEISGTLHLMPSEVSHSFLLFSCHWLFVRKWYFGHVYSFLLITLLCAALQMWNMPHTLNLEQITLVV